MSNIIKFPDPKKSLVKSKKFFDDPLDYVFSVCQIAKNDGHLCLDASVVNTSDNEYTLTVRFVKPAPDGFPDNIA